VDEKTFMALMRATPRSALSTVVGALTRVKGPPALHQLAMKVFARRYGVDLSEAEGTIADYPTFAQFFTRKLKEGLRPVDMAKGIVVSPVDGAVSEVGTVTNGRCVQAKGIDFTVEKLVGDAQAAQPFDGGSFATLYLSPKDYHRIHAPVEGTVDGYTYLPGEFWPVNPISVRNVDALFAVNERLVTWMTTPYGKLAVVAVGATCVARIHASYDTILTHTGQPARTHRYEKPIAMARGAELGMFEMGSTVILIFERGRVRWDATLEPLAVVRMGRRIGAAAA
jgi:phosphatidylserine decarboxylase